MKSICGANCTECELYKNKKCKSCRKTNGCPFNKKCFIANYIEIGGIDNYNILKKELLSEINNLNLDIHIKIEELYPLIGSYVNLEYTLPNGIKTKFLEDNEIYLGNQIKIDNELNRYIGIVANMSFILICEYDENIENQELIVYKKR